MIANLIERGMGKLIRNNLIGKTVQSFAMDFWTVTFLKLTLGKNCLELCFWTVEFKNHPDSVILEKCEPFSNQSFKHNSAHMSLLN